MKRYKLMSFLVVGLSGALLLGGCATATPPPAELSRADAAVERARESMAMTHAPLDLKLAEEKLEKARVASREGEMEKARSLAVEAELDARVAEEKSRGEVAIRDTGRMRESVTELRRQIEGR